MPGRARRVVETASRGRAATKAAARRVARRRAATARQKAAPPRAKAPMADPANPAPRVPARKTRAARARPIRAPQAQPHRPAAALLSEPPVHQPMRQWPVQPSSEFRHREAGGLRSRPPRRIPTRFVAGTVAPGACLRSAAGAARDRTGSSGNIRSAGAFGQLARERLPAGDNRGGATAGSAAGVCGRPRAGAARCRRYVAPIGVSIRYPRETRQARIQCRLNSAGVVIGFR